MRVPITPMRRPTRPKIEPTAESFAFKSLLIVSALFVCAILMVEMEFYVSAPAHSLSETEVTLRIVAN